MGIFSKKHPKKITDAAKTIMDFLDCPCEFIPGGRKPDEVMKRYYSAAEQGRAEGFTPMLIVPDDVLADLFCDEDSREEFTESVMSAERIDPARWFEKRVEYDPELYSEDCFDEADEEIINSEKLYQDKFLSITEFGKKLTGDIILAKIPTKNPWEVFAWLPFGGWNECPENSEIMQIAEYWHREHGAVPAVMTHDVLEFTAPPVIPEKVKKLAREQFIFCSDIITQGLGNPLVLENVLKNSSVWYFWWD